MIASFNPEEKSRAEEVAELIESFKPEDPARKKEVAKLIESFKPEGPARKEGVAELIDSFKPEGKARKKEVAELIASFKPEGKARKTEVAELIASFRPEVEVLKPEVAPEKEKVPEAVKEMTKEEQILAVLKEKPNGLPLAGIGKLLGVHFVTLSATMKALRTEGKVEKRDRLYFLKKS